MTSPTAHSDADPLRPVESFFRAIGTKDVDGLRARLDPAFELIVRNSRPVASGA